MNEKKSNIIWNKYQSIWQELYQEFIYVFKDYNEYTLFVKNCLNQSNVIENKEIDYYFDMIKKVLIMTLLIVCIIKRQKIFY